MSVYVVIDASVAGAWLFPEPYSANAQPVLTAIEARRVTALAPDRFGEEVLRICQKKTQAMPGGLAISRHDAWDRFLDVMTSPIVLLPCDEFHDRAWQLAFAAGLTTHDALYLALAERWNAELWTLDRLLGGPAAGSYAPVRDLASQSFPY